MGRLKKQFISIRTSVLLGGVGFVILFSAPTFAISQNSREWAVCRYELSQKGYSPAKYNEFCRLVQPTQWTCSQLILKKYHSLELAQETCLRASVRESQCFTQVMGRNFDPAVAKRVCRLK